jgi:hypothetical protein
MLFKRLGMYFRIAAIFIIFLGVAAIFARKFLGYNTTILIWTCAAAILVLFGVAKGETEPDPEKVKKTATDLIFALSSAGKTKASELLSNVILSKEYVDYWALYRAMEKCLTQANELGLSVEDQDSLKNLKLQLKIYLDSTH